MATKLKSLVIENIVDTIKKHGIQNQILNLLNEDKTWSADKNKYVTDYINGSSFNKIRDKFINNAINTAQKGGRISQQFGQYVLTWEPDNGLDNPPDLVKSGVVSGRVVGICVSGLAPVPIERGLWSNNARGTADGMAVVNVEVGQVDGNPDGPAISAHVNELGLKSSTLISMFKLSDTNPKFKVRMQEKAKQMADNGEVTGETLKWYQAIGAESRS